MIRTRRSNAPAVLVDDGAAGPVEREKAELFYKVKANRSKKLPGGFKVYKHPDVKTVLETLFHGKCAYCEGRYFGRHPVDIEHFRPKAAVAHKNVLRKPGYYWLAGDWDNLLPSCIDCNRSRKHKSIDTDADPELSGKANLFPISNEEQRAEYPDEENNERRLLLDPCRDRPDKHLEFALDGLVVSNSSKGKKSIDVYGLNRVELVEERRALHLRVLNQMSQVNYAHGKAKQSQAEKDKGALANGLRNLFSFADADQSYLGMVNPLVDRYIELMAKKLRADFAGDVPPNHQARRTAEAFVVQYESAAADPFGELEGN